MKKKEKKNGFQKIKKSASRTSLTLVLAAFVFVILVLAIALTALGLWALTKAGVTVNVDGELQLGSVILFMFIISLVIGGVIAFFSSRFPLKPINELINKMNRLASGDFKARLRFGPTLASHPAFNEILTSFNTMAEELENTELLRRNFINDFSHEFKTPIVSIMGLSKLLSKGNLTDEQRKVYLRSIEEESVRLSSMATNILGLTKVENLSILTDVSKFNLSEQIRSCLLLLEGKWTKKSIELQLDFDEHDIEANEELLKEVWINLLDNAVKFVPHGGTVTVDVADGEDTLCVSVINTGSFIPPDKRERIFNKFYQTDESHSTEGNGIGLAIVKRIVELHRGSISVKSENDTTGFAVTLPKTQSLKMKNDITRRSI